MKVNSNATPIIKPPRKIPVAMEKSVKKELDKMTEKEVIAPVLEPTEWVSQMVATRKKNGDIRICLDPRDLNCALKRSVARSCSISYAKRNHFFNVRCKSRVLANQVG